MDNESLYKFHKKMADKAFKSLRKSDIPEVKETAAQSALYHTGEAWGCLDERAKAELGEGFLDCLDAAQGAYEQKEKHPIEVVVDRNPYRLRLFTGGVEISGVVEADVSCSSADEFIEATIKLYGVKLSTLEEAQGRSNGSSNT